MKEKGRTEEEKQKIVELKAHLEELIEGLFGMKRTSTSTLGERISTTFKNCSNKEIAKELLYSEGHFSRLMTWPIHGQMGVDTYQNAIEAVKRLSKIEKLTREQEVSQAKIEELTREQEVSRAEIEKLTREQEVSQAEIEKLTREQEVSRAEIEKLTREQEVSRAEIEKLTREQEVSRAEIEKLAREKIKGNEILKKTKILMVALLLLAVIFAIIKNNNAIYQNNRAFIMKIKSHPENMMITDLESMVRKIYKLTQGRINITIEQPFKKDESSNYDFNEFYNEKSTDFFYSVSYYNPMDQLKGLDPNIFFGAVPFGMNSQEFNLWLKEDGQKKWDSLLIYQKISVKTFPLGNTGQQVGGWFMKKIERVEDFKDMTMRIYALGGEVLGKFGVYTETEFSFPSKRGFRSRIDSLQTMYALEYINAATDDIIGYSSIGDNSLTKTCPTCRPHFYINGWQEPNTLFTLYVKKEAWIQFRKQDQEIFTLVANEFHDRISIKYQLAGINKLKEWLEKNEKGELLKFKIGTFNNKTLKSLKRKTIELLDRNNDPNFIKIYNSYNAFYKKMRGREFRDTNYIPNFSPLPLDKK